MSACYLKKITRAEAQAKIMDHLMGTTDNDIENIVNSIFRDKELINYEI